MAWSSHGSSNETLVAALVSGGLLRTAALARAMAAVDRANYCEHEPYQDAPQALGYGATISAPHMHAICLEALAPALQPGARVLDVGSGSGYLAAVMARLVTADGAAGAVVGIEHIAALAERSIANIGRADGDLLAGGALSIECGSGWDGWEAAAPYDAIHVGAAAAHVPPALLAQLAPGGLMAIPVGPARGDQSLVLVQRRDATRFDERVLCGVRYVPLTRTADEQLRHTC